MHSSGRDEEQFHLLWTSINQQKRDKAVLKLLNCSTKSCSALLNVKSSFFVSIMKDPLPT